MKQLIISAGLVFVFGACGEHAGEESTAPVDTVMQPDSNTIRPDSTSMSAQDSANSARYAQPNSANPQRIPLEPGK